MRLSFEKRSDALRGLMTDLIRKGQSSDRGWAEVDSVLSEARGVADLISVALDDRNEARKRGIAEWILGRLMATTAIRPLLKLLQHPDPTISFYATDALCEMADKKVLPSVLKTLKSSPNPESRAGAAWVLHKITGKDAARALRSAAVEDHAWRVRESAMHGLISYPGQQTYAMLVRGLVDQSSAVRSMAIFALSCLSSKAGVEVALPALKQLIRREKADSGKGTIVQDAKDLIAMINQPHSKDGPNRRRERTVGRPSDRRVE